MPYMNDPINRPIDELRVLVGDTDVMMEVLQDSEYEYFLDKYGTPTRAFPQAAAAVLMSLSRFTHERLGQLEVYGQDWAKNYRSALTDKLRNPSLTLTLARPYFGGISKSDMAANDLDCDNARPSIGNKCSKPWR